MQFCWLLCVNIQFFFALSFYFPPSLSLSLALVHSCVSVSAATTTNELEEKKKEHQTVVLFGEPVKQIHFGVCACVLCARSVHHEYFGNKTIATQFQPIFLFDTQFLYINRHRDKKDL